ncbi:hypothetical protein [Spiroplasma endosymbiont of Nomada ruficornis]|uniref:hypothetical protein n=1 Tax=Spiroplasma endosymbiont of Nomada ruficornis TaxID=3066325 RepID=UPI00313BD6C6
MKKYKIDNSCPFIDQDFNFITSYDSEEHFYDVLDDRYLKDNGEIDINLLKKKINKIKIILYYINNKKYKCEKTLHSNIKKQSIFLSYNINSIKKLEIFEKQKTSKIFKFKNKLVKFLTFGYYNFEKKRINKIVCEKVNISNQKEELKKVGLKILKLNNILEKIEKEKRRQWEKNDLLRHWYDFASSRKLQNQPLMSNGNQYLPVNNYDNEKSSIISHVNSDYQFYLNVDIDAVNSDNGFNENQYQQKCSIL